MGRWNHAYVFVGLLCALTCVHTVGWSQEEGESYPGPTWSAETSSGWDGMRSRLEPALSSVGQYIQDHVEVGLRLQYLQFIDPDERTYDSNGNLIGGYTAGISTYTMEEKNELNVALYANCWITSYAGLSLGWLNIEGRTLTLDTADPHSDGDLIGHGPTIEILGRYPNDTVATPYGGIGMAFMSIHFEEDFNWHAYGLRNMSADSTELVLLTLGCALEVNEQWSGDISLVHARGESDAKYWLRGESGPRATWTFPLDSYVFRVGAIYRF